LSYARTYFPDPGLVGRLTRLVASTGAVIYGTRPRSLRSLGRFFTTTFPAAVWHCRRAVGVSALLLFVPAAGAGVWLANSPRALEATGPRAVREAYVNRQFEHYYSSEPAAAFASHVFWNNFRVGLLAFASGIAFCVLTAYLLVTNGGNLGMAAGLFAAVGQQPKFWGLILPHGLLELTAVVIAGAAGLRLGWSLIDPGDRTRSQALAEEGRRAVALALGLVLAFGVAGMIEGFVTGSGLPTSVRVGVGVAAETAFLAYLLVQGRAAGAKGLTGAMGEEERGWAQSLQG
jgi:uncharacterized membrane protein SpoIIM required for sporulation